MRTPSMNNRCAPPGRRQVLKLAFRAGLVLAAAVTNVLPASAADFPSKPVKVIVAFAAGGAGDTTARIVGQKMSDALGQPVVVENRTGAGGIIGAQAVAQSAPDGYTVLLAANSFVINSVLRDKMPYDVAKDFVPVVLLAKSPMLLTVNPKLGVKSFAEFVALARREPGKIQFAAAGPGASPHIAFEVMKSALNLDMLYVPFSGETPGLMATASGVVDATFMNYSGLAPLLNTGKVDVITAMSSKRLGKMKDVPTVAESGLGSFDFSSWYGFVAPKGTPATAIARLNAAANKALQSPEVQERLTDLGLFPEGGPSDQYATFLRSETETYGKTIKRLNIKAE